MNRQLFFDPFNKYADALIVDASQKKEYTYEEFNNLITGIAYGIEKLNIEKHTILVIYGYKNSFKPLLLFFACIKCNLIPFIVETGNLSKIVDLKFTGIFSGEAINDPLFDNATNTTICDEYVFYYNIHKEVYIGSENDLLIVSSSGSTSPVPKKILLGKEQTLANIKSNQEALSITQNDATLILLPVSYSYGLIAQFLTHFFAGSKIVLGEKLLSILQLPQLFKKHAITNVFMTPLLARLILYYYQKIKRIDNNLRFITLGGEKPHYQTFKNVLSLFNCPIYSTYGLAEAGPRVATNKYTDAPIDSEEFCIGNVNPGISIKIAANEKWPAKYNEGETGYLQIDSPSIYLGYIKGNQLNKPQSNTILLTKDICVKKDNRFFLLGREGDFIEYKDRIIWFNCLTKELYHTPEILKVKIEKENNNKLEIKIFHRNKISVVEIKTVLKNKYDLNDGDHYNMSLIEFNNTQYK